MQLSLSALSTIGVLSGHGPSSNVSTTSLSRRKSYCLKCSVPNAGPPVVSISTTRDRPIAFGLSQAGTAFAAGGLAAGAGAAGAALGEFWLAANALGAAAGTCASWVTGACGGRGWAACGWGPCVARGGPPRGWPRGSNPAGEGGVGGARGPRR